MPVATLGADHQRISGLNVSVRASALSMALSGFIVTTVAPWHPDILRLPVDHVVRGFDAWTALHVIAVPAVILALFGAVGMVAAHGGRLGRLGRAALLVEVVGVVMTAALASIEAIVFPVLAEHAPTLLAIDGPLLTSPLFIATGVLALGWPLGLAMLGAASARSGRFPRTPGVLLAISGPLFLMLEGPFVPVAGALSAVLFGAAQMWWGAVLWRSASIVGRRA